MDLPLFEVSVMSKIFSPLPLGERGRVRGEKSISNLL
jgi:hypothetical protein